MSELEEFLEEKKAETHAQISTFLAKIGRKGGKKAARKFTKKRAREMALKRWAKKSLVPVVLALTMGSAAAQDKAQYRFSLSHGNLTLTEIKTGRVLVAVTVPDKQMTKDVLRHEALDLTAAFVANGNATRVDGMTEPTMPIVTVAEHNAGGGDPSASIERGIAFAIDHDSLKGCCDYVAVVNKLSKSN